MDRSRLACVFCVSRKSKKGLNFKKRNKKKSSKKNNETLPQHNYTRLPPGAKIADVLKFKGKISSSDRKLMEAAIEEDFESDPLPSGATITDVLKFKGKISSSEWREIEATIEGHCERINPVPRIEFLNLSKPATRRSSRKQRK